MAELPKPSVDEVPGGRGVLVKVLRVGVDGTDKEINAAEHGAALAGYDFLVVGHESFGQVPGWLPRLLTDPVDGLRNYEELFRKLTSSNRAIKVFCKVAEM